MLPLTIVTAMVKDTSEKIPKSMIFFFRSICTFQRMTIGKHMTVRISICSSVLLSIDPLTQCVRDDIHDAGSFEDVVGLPQGCILRANDHCVVYRTENAMKLHQPNGDRSACDGDDEHGPPKNAIGSKLGSKAFEKQEEAQFDRPNSRVEEKHYDTESPQASLSLLEEVWIGHHITT
jgi:hypothetical protein